MYNGGSQFYWYNIILPLCFLENIRDNPRRVILILACRNTLVSLYHLGFGYWLSNPCKRKDIQPLCIEIMVALLKFPLFEFTVGLVLRNE